MMILVTGGTGLVGGHLLWHLLQKNDRVVALKRVNSNVANIKKIFNFYTDNPDEYLQRIEWRIADINDIVALKENADKINIIYHCAAIVSLGNGSASLMDTNVIGTRNMVELALSLNVQKFCFVSSIAACGNVEDKTYIDEETPWVTNDHKTMYALSKYHAEQEVWKGIEKGLNAVIVNPGIILGASGTNTGSSMIFSQVRKGLIFYTLGGSGYVDVIDVVSAMIELVESNITSERFVLVSENLSNKKILTMMANGFGKRRPFINMTRNLLLGIGSIAELIGNMFGSKPLIDRRFALTATNRSYYSSNKIIERINFKFTPIKKCIEDVCTYMKLQK